MEKTNRYGIAIAYEEYRPKGYYGVFNTEEEAKQYIEEQLDGDWMAYVVTIRPLPTN